MKVSVCPSGFMLIPLLFLVRKGLYNEILTITISKIFGLIVEDGNIDDLQ